MFEVLASGRELHNIVIVVVVDPTIDTWAGCECGEARVNNKMHSIDKEAKHMS